MEIRDQALRAEQIEKALASGECVVEIDPAVIDPSPIGDRMPSAAADDESLRDSIAAAHALGRPVRAIVRERSEADALVAQGVENAERRDLTFIERAQFARQLADAGLTQERIATAISAARSNASLMVGLTREMPIELFEAIGRAPRLGTVAEGGIVGMPGHSEGEQEPHLEGCDADAD